MGLIGLELNDSGILAAGGSPPTLLDLDGQAQESPGYALPQKKGLLVGKTAESKAHLFPRQILNHFWDQLNTETLEQSGKHFPLNHAEIVFHHLALIWRQLQSRDEEIVMAVPSFYDREHLGLILGIAQELGMPVKGFVPLALAASSHICPDKMLLYLDIHLHRIEVIYLVLGLSPLSDFRIPPSDFFTLFAPCAQPHAAHLIPHSDYQIPTSAFPLPTSN